MADYQSVWEGKQIDGGIGRIINGELDKLTAQAASSAQYAQAAERGVKDALANIPEGETPIINDLVTGGPRSALSAEMGKKLQTEKADAAATAAALADKANVDQLNNPNLLINWYLADPINRRGQAEYTDAGYTIDGWRSLRIAKVAVSNGLKIYSRTLSGDTAFLQIIEKPSYYQGKTLTFSALITPQLGVSGNIGVYDSTYTTQKSLIFVGDGKTELISLTFVTNSLYAVGLRLFSGETSLCTDFIAAKLELGSTQTLAHQDSAGNWVLNDPPPNKAAELAKCQRYFYRANVGQYARAGYGLANGGNQAVVSLPLPTIMRTSPAITLYGGLWQLERSGGTNIGFTSAVPFSAPSGLEAQLLVSADGDLAPGVVRLVNVGAEAHIDFNAEL